LDVLDYLHEHGMVHGSIKPANIMAAGDELKLSSDGILPMGNSEEPAESRSMYDAPERVKGAILPSGDIWSLGIVLVEALTNRLPAPDRRDEQGPKLPEDIPQPFGDIAAHCLISDPDAGGQPPRSESAWTKREQRLNKMYRRKRYLRLQKGKELMRRQLR
jgi:serine/threonine protein kinase